MEKARSAYADLVLLFYQPEDNSARQTQVHDLEYISPVIKQFWDERRQLTIKSFVHK